MTKNASPQIFIIAGLLIWQMLPVFADGVTVRVTTGSVNNAGWEHNLVQGNPNLRHFGWFPVTSNVQGTMKVYPTKGPNIIQRIQQSPNVQRAVYIKPIHVPTIIRRDPEGTQLTKGELELKNTLARMQHNNHEQDVHATLTKPNDIATYNDAYGSLYASGNNRSVIGKLSNQDVHAQLVHTEKSSNRQF